MKNPIPPDSSFRDVFPGKLALAITAWALLLCACGNASSSITPTSSMIHGLWKGSGSTSITIGADGKFSAIGLPGQIGDWSIGSIPANGDGSWRIGRFDAGAPIGVIFEFPQGSETELLVEKNGASFIMYYDRGDPDEGVSGQYQFIKSRSTVLVNDVSHDRGKIAAHKTAVDFPRSL